jgi:cysteine desulfurase / selenocysteine lyase
MTPAELRAHFPSLENVTWLNAAASSPAPLPVYEAMSAYLKETVEHGDIRYPAWARLKDEVRARLARFIGATPGEVAFTPSTSFGFHVIAQMLKARGITEVLTLQTEFPSTTLPMLYDGLTLRAAKLRGDGTYTLDDLEAALTPKTGAIAVSAVQYASGFRIDLKAVSELCRARGLTFIINAAQGLGHVPLDVHGLGAHFLAATSHKWFWAGYGTGMLFIDRSWLDEVALPFGGWLSVKPEEQFKPWVNARIVDDPLGFTATGTKFRSEASALEAGGGSWVGLHGVNAALALHEAVKPEVTLAHVVALQLKLRERLRQAGFVPTTPDDPATLSGICVIPVQGTPIEVVRALLREAQVATTARGAGLRLSTHVFNDESDLDRLLSALSRLSVKPG